MAALIKERGRRRRGRRAGQGMTLALALMLSAYLMALAVGSAEHPWLAWTSLIPLFFAIRWLRPVLALGAGVLWGAGLFVFSTTVVHTGVPTTWPALLLLLLVPGVYAALGAWLSRLVGFHPLALGVAWMGVELALQPLGLRAGLLAGTLGDGWFVHAVGNVLGYVLAAFAVAAVSASLVSVLASLPVPASPRPSLGVLSDAIRRLFPQDSTCFWIFIVNSARPRAPPFNSDPLHMNSPRVRGFV